MPVNLVVTISLIAALVLVLCKRRSGTVKEPTASKDRGHGTRTARSRLGRRRPVMEEAPARPRMRPRLAMTVAPVETMPPELPAEVAPAGREPEVEVVAITHVPTIDVPESLWDDTETGPGIPAVAATVPPMPLRDDVAALVDAPGWPSPGELVGRFALDDFDPLPPAMLDSDDPGLARDVPDVTDADERGLWRDLDDAATPEPDLPVETWGRNTYREESAGETALADTPVATLDTLAWDAVAETPPLEEVADVETPGWASDDWSFEGQDEVERNSAWADPDPADDSAAVVVTAVADDVGARDDSDETTWSSLSGPTPVEFATEVPTQPVTTGLPHPHGQAPVVIVLTPEMLNLGRPSERERELEQIVRRLEKQLAALTAANRVTSPPHTEKATRATQRRQPARNATTAVTPFSLTKAELVALRALAARRSAPMAARNRARIVLRLARGLSAKTIATQIGVAESTVRRGQMRFADKRLAALAGDIHPPSRNRR